MRPSVLALLTLLVPAASFASLPAGVSQQRGDFAFRYIAYGDHYNSAEMTWLSRFNNVVTGEVLPASQVDELHRAGVKLFYYNSMVYFYTPNPFTTASGATMPGVPSSSADWYRSLLAQYPLHAGQTPPLINPVDASGKPVAYFDYSPSPVYYYDPTSTALQQSRADELIRLANASHYDGVFFDENHWTALEPTAQTDFEARHPRMSGETDALYSDRMAELYDSGVGQFLSALKTKDPGLLIFTNQAFRDQRQQPLATDPPLYSFYLPYAVRDLSESYMTTWFNPPQAQVYVEGQGLQQVSETYVHPWIDTTSPYNSTAFDCKVLINDPIQSNHYTVQACYLNFLLPRYVPNGQTTPVNGVATPVYDPALDREAIYYGVSAAALLGQTEYSELYNDPTRSVPADDAYFVNLGTPHNVGQYYGYDPNAGDAQDHPLAWRLFDNGIVVVNDTGQDQTLGIDPVLLPADVTGLWDVFNNQPAAGFAANHRVSIPANHYAATQRSVTSGRIFAFVRTASGTPGGTGTVEGTVSLASGTSTTPLAGYTVEVSPSGATTPAARTTTDIAGHYTVTGLPAGPYAIQVVGTAQSLVPPAAVTVDGATGSAPIVQDFTLTGASVFTIPQGVSMVSYPGDAPGDAAMLFGIPVAADGSALVAGYDAASNKYGVYPSLPGSMKLAVPGVGYWVKETAAQPLLSLPASPAGPVDVALQPGWNIVGDPYTLPLDPQHLQVVAGSAAPVSLTDAAASGLLQSPLEGYDGTQYFNSTGMQPFQGYWLYVSPTASTSVTLRYLAP